MGMSFIKVKKTEEDKDKIVLNYGLWDAIDGTIILDKSDEKIWIEKPCKEDSERKKPIYGNKATMMISSKYYNGGIEEEFVIH